LSPSGIQHATKTSPFTAALLVTRFNIHSVDAAPPQNIVAAYHQLTGTKISTDSSIFIGVVCCILSAPQNTEPYHVDEMSVVGCKTVANDTRKAGTGTYESSKPAMAPATSDFSREGVKRPKTPKP
jgi:hypothetical protein